MSISPPSDILLDVAAAADPTRVQEATARLAKLAADPSATTDDFSAALAKAKMASASAAAPNGTVAGVLTNLNSPAAGTRVSNAHKPSVYSKFEAVLLQNFVESILPKDEELFGDKNSAGVYRSMMAEQLANQIVAAGGIGIAKTIEATHPGGAQPSNNKTSG